MVLEEDRVFAYPFYGYWRDVGTIESYWQTNMDMIRPGSGITPEEWGIRPNTEADGRPMDRAPVRFFSGCTVQSSMVSAGSLIEGTVVNSVLSPGVQVKKGAVVKDSVIFEDSVVEQGAVVDLAICDKRVCIGSEAVIGKGGDNNKPNKKFPTHLYTGITLIGKDAHLPSCVTIGRNCIISTRRQVTDFTDHLTIGDGESF